MVFPNDPLYRYQAKGEVKPRYFNPEDFFDRVAVVTLADADDSAEAARVMCGRAEFSLHPLGRPGLLDLPALVRRAEDLARRLQPQAVRGYNPLLMGYLAVRSARACGAAGVVSVHDDYSLRRSVGIYGLRYFLGSRGAYHLLHQLSGMNRVSLGQADHVICAYRFPCRHVARWRWRELSVIYNRVDLARFHPAESRDSREDFRILNVGRQFAGKDPAPLVAALTGRPFWRLTLVGDGPCHARLVAQARALGVDSRVEFLPRVGHAELPALYRGHDAFAMRIDQPGVCIPVLEAAASGLPVVVNQPRWEETPEVVGELAEVVPATAAGYRQALDRLAEDRSYRLGRGTALRELALQYDGGRMEQAERELYERLIAGR